MKPNLLQQFVCSRNVFIIIISLFFSVQVLAQAPVNDGCNTATILISSTTCNPTTGTFIGANKTTSAALGCGIGKSPDVWYKFVAKTTHPNISLSNVGSDLANKTPYIQIWANNCSLGSGFVCSTSPLTLATAFPAGLVVGTTYLIRITTNTNFLPPTSGNYNFDICITDLKIDYGKSYTNITDGTVGGTINPGDILEIRTTLVLSNGYWDELRSLYNISFYDTLKAGKGFKLEPNSIATKTNEGKVYKSFTDDAFDSDAGWYTTSGTDTIVRINIGTGASSTTGGTLMATSVPNFANNCIIMATYRVKVNAANDTKINFGGGVIQYATTSGGPLSTIFFPKDSLIVYPSLTACSDAVSPGNLIGNASNGTFGTLPMGSNPSFLQNGGPAAVNTTYGYKPLSSNAPNDYYYSIANNTSATNAINQTVLKGDPSRVFTVFDITGDHTGATNTAKGNLPCDTTKPVSATNPCGYLMIINAAYRPDVAFEYTATGACAETYYEVSAWFKNICYKCGSDSLGKSSGDAGYIPTAPGDTSGVHPNIAMKIDGVDYYTTGELVYQGLGGTQSGSDTLNNWVRRAFVFKTGVGQTSFKVTFRNNAPGGGGNDWAIDDIGLRTCYPTMTYAPPNPIVFMGSPLTISDTVRSYFNSYSFYQWEKKPALPAGSPWTAISGAAGTATPVFNPIYNQFEYVISYTIPGTATLQANAGDLYRMVVASSAANLTNGCNYTPSTTFTLLPTDASCIFSNVNYAVAPQSGNINWNRLNWSLGHVPTCCESAHITYTGTNAGADAVTVNITNDICIINLTLQNTASSATDKIFKTILYPGYSMQMNGYVRMGAPGALSSDSAIFIAKGGGTITVNGNTTIGYPADNAYCIFGTSPDVASTANYVLKGDSLTFNAKSFTNDYLMNVTMSPTKDTAYLVNNTLTAPFPNAVTFETLKIGNAVKASTVIAAGSNANSFLNNRAGKLNITSYSKLVLPANYTINSRGLLSNFDLSYKATMELGGTTGGFTGSNFPLNFNTYYVDSTSTVNFYGASQTLPGTGNNVNAYGNIILSGTGVKSGAASTVNILGDLYRKAGTHTFNGNAGRVTFSSSIRGQKYYADAGTTTINFYDFTNNNLHTNGLSIDSSIGILNELELKPSTKITLNLGDINMRSGAARTSHVTNLGTVNMPTIVYNGTNRFVVERYLFNQKAWRFLASPVQLLVDDATTPTIAAAWREGQSAIGAGNGTGYGTVITWKQGPFGAAQELDYNTQRGSIKYYDDANNVWIELSNTTTTKVANTQGYMLFVRGDRGAANTTAGAGTATNMRIKGKIRTSNQTFNILAAGVGVTKFQSIGNPYPSEINFASITKTNSYDGFIVWSPIRSGLYGVGGYENYSRVGANYYLNGNTGAGFKIRNTIQSGEAFFVQNTNAPAGTITIKEADKGTGSTLVSRASNVDVVLPTINMQLFEKDGTGDYQLMDGATASFDNNYSQAADNNDMVKFTNANDNLFIKSNNKELVVESRPVPTEADSIQLGLTGTRAAAYRLQIDPYVFDNITVAPFLVDKYLQTTTAISIADSTNYDFAITADAASKAADRFVIIFKQGATTHFTTIAAARNTDKTITVNFGTANEKNVTNYTVEQSNDGTNFTALPTSIAPTSNIGGNPTYTKQDATASKAANWYRVKTANSNGSNKYSAIAMVAALVEIATDATPAINIYPNPVENGNIQVHFNNQAKGSYSIKVLNQAGQTVGVEQVQIANNRTQKTIQINNLAAGSYQVVITNASGEQTIVPMLAK